MATPLEGEILGATSGARAVVKPKRMVANTNGDLEGIIWIPNPAVNTNPRFATGTVLFVLLPPTDPESLGEVDFVAQHNYVVSGVIETKQQTILAVRNAELVRDTVTQDRMVSNTFSRVTRDTGWYDPLAQSFLVESKGGAFLTSVDIYFRTS